MNVPIIHSSALVSVATAVMVLAGCQTVGVKEEAKVTVQLAPMEKPARDVGHERHSLKNGKPFVSTLVARNGELETYETSEGCSSTRHTAGFAPAVKWWNCGGADGTQTVSLNGSVWPLEVGKKWSYKFNGSNDNGNSWNGTRNCEVQGVSRISTGIGEHNTYKVFCRDKWNARTWYLSPEQQGAVYYENRKTRKNVTNIYEFVKHGKRDS